MMEKKELKQEVAVLKNTCDVLDSDLSLYHNDTSVLTRTGRQFTESIEKCVMELVGECEVSSKNIPKVIQAVARWILIKNIVSSDLPC